MRLKHEPSSEPLQVMGKVIRNQGMQALHPAPYSLHPTPYTLHSTPYAPHPTPYTGDGASDPEPGHASIGVGGRGSRRGRVRHACPQDGAVPTPYTLHPTPCTLLPAPCTLNPTPYTLRLKCQPHVKCQPRTPPKSAMVTPPTLRYETFT